MVEVLVTGGSGHLGTDVVRLLRERGVRVRVLSRTPHAWNDVKSFEGDLATGVQQSRVPYLRRKAQAENIVRSSAIPWTILPATPFHWLLARFHDHMTKQRVWVAPSNLPMQPGDSADFAPYIVESLLAGPAGDGACFAGPQVLSQGEISRQYQAARGLHRRILEFPLPGFAARASGRQTCPDGRLGTTTRAEWLAKH